MDKELNDSDLQTSQDNDNGRSLVGKLKKNVSEIISNTPLSKWFRKQNEATPTSSVRRRQDDSDDEEDMQEFQPPTKRSKLPPSKETLSLNVSEVLSPISSTNNVKKPLYRNFPEPIAGPSGYQTRKMLNSTSMLSEGSLRSKKTEGSGGVFKNPKITAVSAEVTNKEGHSDSEESTSGYSSGRLGSKEIVSQESSKQTSPLEGSPRKNRSLFQSSSRLFTSDRSLSPNRNSSLSSRMPSFNPSTFGSSSFVDRTLSTKRILNSPFYNGQTIYGGASAYGRRTKRAPQDIQSVLRQSVKIKPANKGMEKGDLQLGKTARRILDTLEQYSSPVSDAKKIPVASKKHKSEGSLTKYVGANPYVLRESRSASNRELQVPSVTDLAKIKMNQQKSRLQDSTEAARQIATKSSSILNTETYQIPVQRGNDKLTTKMKTKITSVRQRVQVEEVVPELKLNPVSLPITELPKFDITIPPPVQKPLATSSASNVVANDPVPVAVFSKTFVEPKPITDNKVSKENNKPIGQNPLEFKFSSPLVLAEYLKPLKALNNFKFSEPLVKKRRSIHPELDDQEHKVEVADASKANKKVNGENVSTAGKSIVDNVMEKFKPKEGTWECSVCMIRNQSDKTKCAACESPKPASRISAEPVKAFFGGTPFALKPAETTWECPTCMIRNKEDLQKCAACEEKKPEKSTSNGFSKASVYTAVPQTMAVIPKPTEPSEGSLWECASCHIKNMHKASQCLQCQKPKPTNAPPNGSCSFNFGTKFTYPSDTWECPTCMIRNKEELPKCAACETPKPPPKGQASQPMVASFGSNFQKKDGEWDCSVCMIRNKTSTEKCQCCDSSNPNFQASSSSGSSAAAVAASSPPKASSFSFGIGKSTATSFTFGVPPGLQTSPKTNAALVLGEKQEEPVAKPQPFTFGVPPKDTKVAEPKKDLPKADVEAKPSPSKPVPTFGFGTKPTPSETTPNKSTPTFSFGTTPKTSESTPSKSTPTFSFGTTPKISEVTPSKSTPTFSFSPAKETQKPTALSSGFGAAVKKTEVTVTAMTANPTFTFGAGNKTDNKQKDANDTPKVNPLLKPSEKLPDKAALAPVGFSFGLSKAPVPSSTSTQARGPGESSPTKRSRSSTEEPAPLAKVPMFFKTPTTTNGDISKVSSPFSKPAEENKPAGGFNFSFGPAKAKFVNTVPAFGTTVVSQADSSKPMFKFGSGPEAPKQTNGFGFESTTPTFGVKANQAEATKPFSFVSPAPATQAPAPSFGTTPQTKRKAFSFGGPTTESTPASASFSFSSDAKTTAPFSSFGAPKTQPPPFGFSQQPTPVPSFSFGQKKEQGFGGGPTSMSPFGAKPDSVFGSAPAPSAAPNGAFNFGAPAPTSQKAGFSFGASSASTDGGATQSGFSFGSPAMNASAPTGSGGFNFSGPAPSFDANTKPSFNFTGGAGIAAFSAPPAQDGTAMPQRKIKKAIRRTVR